MKKTALAFLFILLNCICTAQTGVISTVTYTGSATFPEDPNLNPNWDWEQGDILQGGSPRYWIFLQNKPNATEEYCALPPWRQQGSWTGLEDRKKEDGWILLAREFGSPERRLIGTNPYFVLYNTQRSVIRVFILMLNNNILKNYTYATIELFGKHKDAGTLSHLAPVAYAMDKVDKMYNNASSEVTSSALLLPNFWVYGDFPLGLDTNVLPDTDTDIPSSMIFTVKGIEVNNVELKINGFGAQGDKKFVADFMNKNNFGSTSFSLNKLNMPQLDDFSLTNISLKATSPDWNAIKNLFKNINIDMNFGSIDASSPFKDLFDCFGNILSGLSVASPLNITGLDLGGLFNYFIGGGMSQNNINQTAPTFISMNYLANGTIKSSDPVAIVTIPIPASRKNYKEHFNGGEVGIIRNEPVGILTLTKTPVVYKKTFSYNFQDLSISPGQFYEFELAENPQIAINSSAGLEFKKCEVCLVTPYSSFIPPPPLSENPIEKAVREYRENRLKAERSKIINDAKTGLNQRNLIELELPIDNNSAYFRSLPVPLQSSKGRTMHLPTHNLSLDPKLKIKATFQRKDDPNAQPVVFIATYNVDVVERTDLPSNQPLPLIPPQDIKLVQTSTTQVSVSWTANMEKSVTDGGGYNVYRDIYYGTTTIASAKINSSLLTTPSLTENNIINFTIPAGTPSGVDIYACYRVEAVSVDGTVSAKSDPSNIFIGKTITGTVPSNPALANTMIAFGNVINNRTLNFPSGTTLVIREGTFMKFASGASLVENGKLIAVGTPTQKITFTSTSSTTPGSWGSLYLTGSGANGSSICYANIQYGTEVDVINASGVTISDCSIINSSSTGIKFSGAMTNGVALRNSITNSNVYHGIVVENAAYVQCDRNKIVKNNYNHQGAGILYGGGGNGTLWQNDILGWNWGVGAIWGSSPQFRTEPLIVQYRSNRITNCSYGVYSYNNAFPIIGFPFFGFSYNSIYNNSKNIYYTSGGSLPAFLTYWGKGGPNPTTMFVLGSSCSIVTAGWCSSDPWEGIPLSDMPGGNIAELPSATSEIQHNDVIQFSSLSKGEVIVAANAGESIFDGITLRHNKGKKAAKDFFKSYIVKHPDDQAAYVELYNCADDETTDDIIQYFSQFPAQASKEHDLLLPYLYLRRGDVASAKAINERIFSRNKNKKLGLRAKLNNFYIALYDENDVEKAMMLFKEVSANPKLTTSIELELAKSSLETYPGIADDQRAKLRKESLEELTVPDHYDLFQNYPNPFNPMTTIGYQIPLTGIVTIKIYDVLGREIETLVNEEKSAGKYSTTFTANYLASGLYIVKLVSQPLDGGQADAFTAVKKMLLMK